MLKVVSYNIHSGVGVDGKFSYRRIGRFLASLDADIVCLQEMDLRAPEIDKAAQIQALKAGHFNEFIPSPAVVTKHGYYGNAILSRVKHLHVKSLDISVKNRQPRNIQEVLFQIDGKSLRIINTHKGLKQNERMQQMKQLEAVVDVNLQQGNTPLLVTGDFNEWLYFSRAFRHINSKLKQHKMGATFPNRFPLFKLDRIWTSPGNIVQRAYVIKTPESRLYSDHFPVCAELTLV
ncbi:endonuclease/exonuclease/phosphatase family protein [Glaciecola sp. 1036]|uniref:endonuclease/exonuclease/phosphatase family protein n=1 Tax=Alteromonadaceae TaxID=72275 RepID=UPI003CFEB9C0